MSVQSHVNARPTLEDVAARAGVSRATASRVLNASPRVSPEAQEAVTAAARDLGYQPNQAARALVTRRSGAVAVVFSEPEPKIFDDPHFAWLTRAAARALADADVQMVLMLAHSPQDQDRAQRFLQGGHVDGALVFAPHKGDRLLALARKLPLPVVYAGRPWGSLRGLNSVDHDNTGGGELATRHLMSLGRGRIASVTGPLDELAAADRLAGWRRALGADDERTALLTEDGGFSREGGKRAMAALLGRAPDLDAVFVASDLMAAGALDALREAGRRVPEDVAVVGFDDHPSIAPHTTPALTTVRQDTGNQVSHMVAHLLRLLSGEQVRAKRQVLPTQLVRRESA
ncbi:LacI family DNA-binding transcriptional regulator [Actinosynnema pretiosum subsp. pretiosum]|uniref:Transcriptional regulator, LacI family n=2 Tax=Actinosynnema TaxID=40566 RepID=C6WCA0_ACTMD|nr:LacI family DNA-binding transcriptional regulator [Actinosynnema mirum]ACU39488.1 transcriptional regulator, LacI family [Actinosynnema mirum DSM 43827]QUF03148.1 LacI family DNA-binding transcriptional regulator [Actinosynnema pretiosum subsp. pretiosum]